MWRGTMRVEAGNWQVPGSGSAHRHAYPTPRLCVYHVHSTLLCNLLCKLCTATLHCKLCTELCTANFALQTLHCNRAGNFMLTAYLADMLPFVLPFTCLPADCVPHHGGRRLHADQPPAHAAQAGNDGAPRPRHAL